VALCHPHPRALGPPARPHLRVAAAAVPRGTARSVVQWGDADPRLPHRSAHRSDHPAPLGAAAPASPVTPARGPPQAGPTLRVGAPPSTSRPPSISPTPSQFRTSTSISRYRTGPSPRGNEETRDPAGHESNRSPRRPPEADALHPRRRGGQKPHVLARPSPHPCGLFEHRHSLASSWSSREPHPPTTRPKPTFLPAPDLLARSRSPT